jgi:hypothetical protein
MAGILSKKCYLTKSDRAMVQALLEKGILTIFKLSKCKWSKCDKDVPPGKDFCSEACFKKAEDTNGDDEG